MAKILNDVNLHFSELPINFPILLQALIDRGFREEQECILFKDFVYFGAGRLLTDLDKSSFECFLNEFNLHAYIPEAASDLEILQAGIEFCKKLHAQLNRLFKNKFRIILSMELNTDDENEIDGFGHCTIKFHTIRQGDDDKLSLNNLPLLTDAAIMVLE